MQAINKQIIHFQMSKSEMVGGLWSLQGQHHFSSQHRRFHMLFETRKNYEEDETKKNCKNPGGCVAFCRLQDGNNLGLGEGMDGFLQGCQKSSKFYNFQRTRG